MVLEKLSCFFLQETCFFNLFWAQKATGKLQVQIVQSIHPSAIQIEAKKDPELRYMGERGSRCSTFFLRFLAEKTICCLLRLCQRVYLLERDLLFQPSSCLHRCQICIVNRFKLMGSKEQTSHEATVPVRICRLELAVLLQQGATAIKDL